MSTDTDDTVMHLSITFKGQPFNLAARSLEEGGAIATPEQYENGQPSFAYLMEDGTVWRYNEQIGDLSDIVVLDQVVAPTPKVSIAQLFINFLNDDLRRAGRLTEEAAP